MTPLHPGYGTFCGLGHHQVLVVMLSLCGAGLPALTFEFLRRLASGPFSVSFKPKHFFLLDFYLSLKGFRPLRTVVQTGQI